MHQKRCKDQEAGVIDVKYKIRKGDTVEVISGRSIDKGQRGEVIKVYRDKKRVAVQGINIRKKHQGQIQTQGRAMTPGIIEFEGLINRFQAEDFLRR